MGGRSAIIRARDEARLFDVTGRETSLLMALIVCLVGSAFSLSLSEMEEGYRSLLIILTIFVCCLFW